VTAFGWLRVGLLATLAGFTVALVVGVTIGEAVLDRAIALEGDLGDAAEALPFTRSEQRAGFVLAQLAVTVGLAFVLAGLASVARIPAEPVAWLRVCAGAALALTVVPAIVVPPLPPGADTGVAIGERQALYIAAIAAGAIAAFVALRTAGLRTAVLAVAVGGLVAALAPGREIEGVPADLARDFRLVSIGGQLAFWLATAAAGAVLLHRARARA
jgi:Probable cobalt transporter subunit (CbtA)